MVVVMFYLHCVEGLLRVMHMRYERGMGACLRLYR